MSEGGDYRDPTPTNTGRIVVQGILDGPLAVYETAFLGPVDATTYSNVDTPSGILNRPSNPAICSHGCVHVSSFVNDPSLPRFSRRIHKYRFKILCQNSYYCAHLGYLVPKAGVEELLGAPAGLAFTADGRLLATSHREDHPGLIELSSCGCESLTDVEWECDGEAEPKLTRAIACGPARRVVGSGVLEQANYVLPVT